LGVHHHAGEPGAAGVDKQSAQIRHQQQQSGGRFSCCHTSGVFSSSVLKG